MNICAIGKYPPIEGVVSAEMYWSARGLAERGHSVFAITNADEVEPVWRIHMTSADYAGPEYAWKSPSGSGSVQVTSTHGSDPKSEYYIPFITPSVTRLAAIAADIIRARKCSVIYAYYLEPYAVAAHLASSWTGVPYVIKHSGTDLFRLAQSPTLRTTYVEVFKSARRVIASGGVFSELVACGAAPEKIVSDMEFGIPTTYFHPGISPLPWAELSPPKTENHISPFTLRPELPILGFYGKLGKKKGSFDLLHAVHRLKQSGLTLQVIALSHGPQENRFRELVRELNLTEQVYIGPFLPNWKIPPFIRMCDAVAVLEHGFEITAHAPVTPREIVACAGCLVISAEVAGKQPFRMQMRNGRNIIAVSSPADHEALAVSLQYALEDRFRAAAIGARGRQELNIGCSYEKSTDSLEKLLKQVSEESATKQSQGLLRTSAAQRWNELFPLTRAVLDPKQKQKLYSRLDAFPPLPPSEVVQSLADVFVESLNGDAEGALVREVCRYELLSHRWRSHPHAADLEPGVQLLAGAPLTENVIPRFTGENELVEFSCNVAAVLAWARYNGAARPPLSGVTHVFFSSGAKPIIVNGTLLRLLQMVRRGTFTLREIEEQFGYSPQEKTQARAALHDVLEGFYWSGLIRFYT